MGAPVCPITPVDPPIPQPDPRTLPYVPQATDMASAIAAINALRQIINTMLNRRPNTVPNPHGVNVIWPKNHKKKPRYTEVHRVTQKVRVYQKVGNTVNKSNYVDVERIAALIMRDNLTGEEWLWKHDQGTP